MNANFKIDPQVLEIVEAEFGGDEITLYGLAKVLNRILAANGAKLVRPQMMYNYARNGMIVKGEKIFGESLRMLNRTEAAEFVLRYVLKHGFEIKFAIEENPDQLMLDLEI